MNEVNWRASVATAVFPLAPCNKSDKKTRTKCSLLSVCTGDNQGKQEPLDCICICLYIYIYIYIYIYVAGTSSPHR